MYPAGHTQLSSPPHPPEVQFSGIKSATRTTNLMRVRPEWVQGFCGISSPIISKLRL